MTFALLATLCLAGCGSDPSEFQYMPHPAVAALPATQPDAGPPIEVLATVLGVRQADRDSHAKYAIDVRLRLRNYTPRQVVFDPNSLELTTGELLRFSPPFAKPDEPFPLKTESAETVDATFEFPPGRSLDDTNLNSLQLHWMLDIEGRRVEQIVDFHRVVYQEHYYYYRPYWDYPRYRYYEGGGHYWHRR